MSRVLAGLRANVRRQWQLRLFLPVSKRILAVRPPVLMVMLGLSLATQATRDFAAAGPDPYFNEWGIAPWVAKWSVVAMAISILTGRGAKAPVSRAIADLAGISAVNALLTAALFVIWRAYAQTWQQIAAPVYYLWLAAWALIGLWSLSTLLRAGHRLWPRPMRLSRTRLLVAAMLPALLIPRNSLFDGPATDWRRFDVWYYANTYLFAEADTGDDEGNFPPVDYEAVFYRQADMVRTAVAAMRPSASGGPRFYFVGLAPSSQQTVFKSEVTGAQSAFDAKLGTKGRSIVMINSGDTLDQYPLANLSNLDLALSGIAKLMRPQTDVLAVFVTSHGSAGLISVSMPGFSLNEITPDLLARALKKSGIKNRVIILSACYSGSFIPALANDDTLVMTAASAATTSFGCSNERDWTYFGDAFFNHALSKTASLPNAFALASEEITKWESEQKLTPSNPQISLGKNIAKILETIDRERAASLH